MRLKEEIAGLSGGPAWHPPLNAGHSHFLAVLRAGLYRQGDFFIAQYRLTVKGVEAVLFRLTRFLKDQDLQSLSFRGRLKIKNFLLFTGVKGFGRGFTS